MGDPIDRYIVLDELGAGAMGRVLLAYDPELERRVAIKLVAAPTGDHSSTRRRASESLVREGKALARLSHPNVVAIYDVGRVADDVFLAMEYVRGRDLTARPPRLVGQADGEGVLESIRLLIDVARALEAAHAIGLCHRDVKPANIMVDDAGRARLTDFGLAQLQDLASITTDIVRHRAGATPSDDALPAGSGTPAYMAPEQHLGREVDARSDQFALSVVAFELLFGFRPFRGPSMSELYATKTSGHIPWPAVARAISPALRDALARGLSPAMGDRHHDMRPLIIAMEGEVQRRTRPRRRRWMVLALVVATASVGVQSGLDDSESGKDGCLRDDDPFATLWNSAEKTRFHDHFEASGLGFASVMASRIVRALDDRVENWRDIRSGACAEQAANGAFVGVREEFDLQMACLHRRAEETRAYVQTWNNAEAAMFEHAIDTLDRLSPIDDCRDLEALRRPHLQIPTELVPRVGRIRSELDEISMLESIGETEQASARLEAIWPDIVATAFIPLHIEGHALASRVSRQAFDVARSLAHIRAGYIAAIRLGDPRWAASQASAMVYTVGYLTQNDDAAEELAALARAHLLAAGSPPALMARWLMETAPQDYMAGRFDETEYKFREEGRILRALDPTPRPKLANNLSNLAYAISRDPDRQLESIALLEQSVAMYRRALGDDHPHAALPLTNLALSEGQIGRFGRAIAHARRAIELVDAAYGARAESSYHNYLSLAELLRDAGWTAEARDVYAQTADISTRAHGPHSVVAIRMRLPYAVLSARMGDTATAEAQLIAAEAAFRAAAAGERKTTNMLRHRVASARVAILGGALTRARGLLDRVDWTSHDVDWHWVTESMIAELEWAQAQRDVERVLDRARALWTRASQRWAAPHAQLVRFAGHQSTAARLSGRADEALSWAERAVGWMAAVVPPNHPALARPLMIRGLAKLALGDADALKDLHDARKLGTGALDPSSLAVMDGAIALAQRNR